MVPASFGFPADVAIKGDTIVKVGQLDQSELSAKQTIDARGLTVAPGFIDIHSHSDYFAVGRRHRTTKFGRSHD
jgi:N-acyl-D-aspartate/D-glutamate deacylase